jgi:hypothetical protein
MIKVSISAEDWAVSATVHDADIHNPFAGLNRDAVIAGAIDDALMYASPSICDPLYILARVVAGLDKGEGDSLQAVAENFLAAAEEYIRAAEHKKHPINNQPT